MSSEGLCAFEPSKGRHKNCIRPPAPGCVFCTTHKPLVSTSSRTTCGLCNQSVPTSHLVRHDRVCSGKLAEVCYCRPACNVNFRGQDVGDTRLTALPRSKVIDEGGAPDATDPEDVEQDVEGDTQQVWDDTDFQCRILSLYNLHVAHTITTAHLDELPGVQVCTHVFQAGLESQEMPKHLKHRRQEASIAGQLMKSGLCSSDADSDVTILDLGAGKGSLCLSLSRVFSSPAQQFVCVDRKPYQQQSEKTISRGQRRFRAKADLADADIKLLLEHAVSQGHLIEPRKVVGVGKHLCGSALDYALNALRQYREGSAYLSGVCIASCCHSNIASLDATAASEWLRQVAMVSEQDFRRMRQLAGSFNDGDKRKAEIGCAVKRLIDFGRCEYIKKHLGMGTARLVYYVATDVSPENCLILAS